MQKVHLIVPLSFASVVSVLQLEDCHLWLLVGLEIGQTLEIFETTSISTSGLKKTRVSNYH